MARVKEVAERPIFLEALNDRLNQSQYFLDNMQNYTGQSLWWMRWVVVDEMGGGGG